MRSLQAGIMFGLGHGRMFCCGRCGELWLLLIATALRPLHHLIRTLVLSLQAEWKRAQRRSKKIHDFTGHRPRVMFW